MNLSLDALRWLSVRLLLDQTWAGTRVFDSPSDSSEIRTAARQAPFIAVYTDEAEFNFESDGMPINGSLYDAGGKGYLVVECAFAGSVSSAPPPPDDSRGPGVPEPPSAALLISDEQLEVQIGLLARQALTAFSDPDNPWAELWRILARATKVEIARGGPASQQQQAQRYASRVMRIHVDLLGEPVSGAPLPANGFWAKFIAAAEDDDAYLKPLGELVALHLAGGTNPLPPWRVEQSAETMTAQAARAIGIGALDGLGTDAEAIEETPILEQVTFPRV